MALDVIAKNAKRLRHDRDLTQAEVAKRAKISIPTYSKIETGDASPRMTTLYKIADALGVEIQELLEQVRSLQAVRFRAQKRLKRRDQILARASRWLDDFNALLEIQNSDINYTLVEIPAAIRHETIERRPFIAARLARQRMGLDSKEPIHDITGLFAAHGIKVLGYPSASDVFFGMSIGQSDGGPAIVVNTWERISVERRIFSAAHELGHLLLHLDAYDIAIMDEEEQQEKEADIFASQFLMPEEGFSKEWQETAGLSLWDRILKVKRIYHVSYKAVLYRLTDMGVFDSAIWQKAQIFLKKRYSLQRITKSFEPEKLQSSDFVTDWLDRLVRGAIENQFITLSRASEILGISLNEARQRAKLWAEEKIATKL